MEKGEREIERSEIQGKAQRFKGRDGERIRQPHQERNI